MIGAAKPDPRAIEEAIATLGVSTTSCLFFDDIADWVEELAVRGHARVPRGPRSRTNSRRRRFAICPALERSGRRRTMTEQFDEPGAHGEDASLVTLIDQPQCT